MVGRIILCNSKKANKPYYIESLNINLYTIEELCYYLQNNIYLIDEHIINDEIISWIETELEMGELANGLRMKRSSVKGCIVYILKSAGYSSVVDIETTGRLLTEIEGQSDIEKRKLKARHLVKSKKYAEAIFEYRKICDTEIGEELEAVYNNMGAAYAGLFLFGESAQCFYMAYKINNNEKIYKRLMYALSLMTKAEAEKMASDNNISDDYNAIFMEDVEENNINSAKLKIYEKLIEFKEEGYVQQYFSELNEIMRACKNEYNNFAF